MRGAACCLALLLAAPLPVPAAGKPVAGVPSAREGDVLLVGGQEVRLYGIDAPDPGQRCENVRGKDYDCFAVSRKALEVLAGTEPVSCETQPGGGRMQVGVCRRPDGQDIGAAMVLTGYALAYRSVSTTYLREEAQAVSRRRGLWGGRVEPPWIWRSRQVEQKLEQRPATSAR